MLSVIVVAVEEFVRIIGEEATAVPAVVVVIDCAPNPFVPLKLNVPVPPFEILFRTIVAGVSSLLIVQVADWLSARVKLEPDNVPASQDQVPAVYPEGPVSESAYVPTFTLALVTAAPVVTPVMVVGPVAFNIKSATTLLPPLLFVTVFTKVSFGEMSSLLIVHVAF